MYKEILCTHHLYLISLIISLLFTSRGQISITCIKMQESDSILRSLYGKVRSLTDNNPVNRQLTENKRLTVSRMSRLNVRSVSCASKKKKKGLGSTMTLESRRKSDSWKKVYTVYWRSLRRAKPVTLRINKSERGRKNRSNSNRGEGILMTRRHYAHVENNPSAARSCLEWWRVFYPFCLIFSEPDSYLSMWSREKGEGAK